MGTNFSLVGIKNLITEKLDFKKITISNSWSACEFTI